MNSLQDARDAQQMWEYKLNNTGRESIVLRDGKPGWLARLLDLFTRDTPSKDTTSGSNLKEGYQPV
jgi:hypothetical protein